MPSQFTIRPLCRTDKNHWLEMWSDYMHFYETTCSTEVTEHTFNTLLSADKQIGCLVACDHSNVIIGFLTYIAHFSTWKIAPVCYLNDLFVKPSHRKAGVATVLLEKLDDIANTEHWSRVYWLTKPNNEVARKFYDKVAKGEAWIRYIINVDRKNKVSP